ncbi:HPP-domain-containing protein, partial [Aureobasidium melanogenum]
MHLPTIASLPSWCSHWLGHRPGPVKPPPKYLVYLWSFIGAFCGLAVLTALFGHSEYFIGRGVPIIVASYGASAVLVFGAIESPLAQPRALIFGHFISALIGTCITKLFEFLPESRFQDLRWLAASLSSAIAVVAMQVTETTHPPAGATALLPATNEEIRALSWYFLPIVLLSSVLLMAVALINNNIQRRYPTFWLAPPKPQPAIPTTHTVQKLSESSQ